MNVTQDLSILHLILNASAVVQAVMILLAGVSFMSWYYIFMKWYAVKNARAKTETFERDFWSGGDLTSLYNSAVNDRHHAGSMERIFESGFREFAKLKGQKNLDAKDVIDGARRAMRATFQREMDALEGASRLPRLGRLGFALHRPVRNGVGHHAFVPRPRPTSARRRFPRWRRASPRRWSPPPSACSRQSPPYSPTTASPMTSTAWRPATSRSWKSSPTSCSGRCVKPCASAA
jgi:hypothetical protein